MGTQQRSQGPRFPCSSATRQAAKVGCIPLAVPVSTKVPRMARASVEGTPFSVPAQALPFQGAQSLSSSPWAEAIVGNQARSGASKGTQSSVSRKSQRSQSVNCVRVSGTVPDNSFSLRSKKRRSDKLPNSFGTDPDRSLACRLEYRSSVRFPNAFGIVPDKSLGLKLKKRRSVSSEASGREPDRPLKDRFEGCKAVKRPAAAGTGPDN